MTMDTKALLAEAEALKPQLLTDRRTLHRDPEVGPSLPRTATTPPASGRGAYPSAVSRSVT